MATPKVPAGKAPASGAAASPRHKKIAANSNKTSISFVNASTAAAALVYWVPADGQREKRKYKRLRPGEAYTQPTYNGHAWQCENAEGVVLLRAVAHAGDHLHAIPSSSPEPGPNIKTKIAFVNDLGHAVQVFWVNAKTDAEVNMGQVAVGATLSLNSFCSHEFRVRAHLAPGKPCILQCVAAEQLQAYPLHLADVSPFKSCKNSKLEHREDVGIAEAQGVEKIRAAGGSVGQFNNPAGAGAKPVKPTDDGQDLLICRTCYEETQVHGFTVCLEPDLPAQNPNLLSELSADLAEIIRVVPPAALAILQKTRVYMNRQLMFGKKSAPTIGSGICHHASAKWLARHGNQTEKVGCVECYNVKHYLNWRREQPAVLLHELSHHLQFALGDAADEIISRTFDEAEASGKYESVKYCRGQMKRHYALTDNREYFAECSEAFFSSDRFRNDYFPFVRSELEEFDPAAVKMCEDVWYKLPEQMQPIRGAGNRA